MQGGVRILSALLGVIAGCSSSPVWTIDYSDDHNWYLAAAPLGDQLLIAGGQPGTPGGQPGRGQLLLRGADSAADYRVLASPQPGMLWWVHAAAGGAWLCGENGSILRFDPTAGGTLSAVPTGSRATLYGIWAFSDEDVWAVGGESGGVGVVLHGGRGGLVVDSTVPSASTLYKLWASDPEHLFVVGQDGTLLRRIRQAAGFVWIRDTSPVRDRLLTAWGTAADAVFAVGGLGTARLLRFDGQVWQTDAAVAGLSGLSGLHIDGELLLITGQSGLIASRPVGAAAGTALRSVEPLTELDLHGAVSALGARWAVGGNLSQYPVQPARGIVLRQGR